MMKVMLRGCPFCGKKAQMEARDNWRHDKNLFAVRCTTSTCPGHPNDPVWYDSKETATKNWNRRKGRCLL